MINKQVEMNPFRAFIIRSITGLKPKYMNNLQYKRVPQNYKVFIYNFVKHLLFTI